MSRLPFNPEKMRGPEPGDAQPPRGAPPDAIPVSLLAERIDQTLRGAFRERVKVFGEISGFNDRTHWYFNLKDETAVISCVMFASGARKAGFTPANGQAVVVSGRVEFYAKQGRTQFYVESLTPIGAGELEMRYRALCDELRALGWFDVHRKRPLPRFPRRIAIVTSRTGAALQDVRDTVRRRCAGVEIALVDVRVQGEAAAPEIARALRWLSARHASLAIDAIILTRGGGSIEDLWAFNERIVAHAVLECPIPVVAAIGHETDTTIAELVADERAATPTQAAMRLTPDRVACHEQLDQLAARLRAILTRQLRHDRARVETLARRPFFADPHSVVIAGARTLAGVSRRLVRALHHQLSRDHARLERAGARLARNRPEAVFSSRRGRLDRAEHALRHSMRQRLTIFQPERSTRDLRRAIARFVQSRQERLDSLERELIVVGPQHVLARGYSVTTDAQGRAIRTARAVRPGEVIQTRVADGAFHSAVGEGARRGETSAPSPPSPVGLPPRRRPPSKRRRADDPDQLGLF